MFTLFTIDQTGHRIKRVFPTLAAAESAAESARANPLIADWLILPGANHA